MDNSESGLKIGFGSSSISLAELNGKSGESEDCFLIIGLPDDEGDFGAI